jgi:hypothetical protein
MNVEDFVEDALSGVPKNLARRRWLRRALEMFAREGWRDARIETAFHCHVSPTFSIREEHRGDFRVEIVVRFSASSLRRLCIESFAVLIPDVDLAGRWWQSPSGELVKAIDVDDLLLDESCVAIDDDGVRRPQVGAVSLGGHRSGRSLAAGLRVVDGFRAVTAKKSVVPPRAV